MSPEAKARARRIAMILGGALLALVVAAIVVNQVNKHEYTPQKQAAALMQAISDGDADTAVTLMGSAAPAGNRALLTKSVYSGVDDRVTGYTITGTQDLGSEVVVHAQATQSSGVSDVPITLTKQGKSYGLFDKWVVSSVGTGSLGIRAPQGATVTVNGATLKLGELVPDAETGEPYSLPALPGTYTVTLPDSGKYLKGAQEQVKVGWGPGGGVAELQTSLTPQFAIDVQAKVNEALRQCAKSTAADPGHGCPSAYVTPANTSNTWTINSFPVISVGSDVQSVGDYSFSTQTPGRATYRYFEKDYLTNAPKATSISPDFSVYGTARIVGDQVEVTLR